MAKKLFLLIGAPGSGKTTDASIIAQRHERDMVHYSTGDLLRQEVARGSELGNRINTYMLQGALVPLEIIMDTLIHAIKNAPTGVVLVDGYPRSVEQMEVLDALLADEEEIELISVIEVRVSEEVARERILGRVAEALDGEQRLDDTMEVFADRMKIYSEPLFKIQSFYQAKKMLKVIDGEKSLDIVISMMELYIMSRSIAKLNVESFTPLFRYHSY